LFQPATAWQVTLLPRENIVAWWLPLLAAPFAGSFLFALVRRLPREEAGLWGRSRCEACGHRLGPLELVPVASFLTLRGRCRACGTPIPAGHLFAELAAVLVAAAAIATGADGLALWAGCGLGWTLLALAWIDWDFFLLPDVLTLPLLVAGLGEAWLDAPWALTDRAFGAIAGYAGLRLLGAIYHRLRGREGLGQGDAKLLAVGGAWLGWPALGHVLLLAAVFGLGLAVARRLRGLALTAGTALPFGPPLAAAIFFLWLVE
jgi:leader peptidase (prepilin peptidase)/N-methyltransferase